jgi:CheY-like chemotaxis protein
MTAEPCQLVLVVDDDAPDREQITSVLQRFGVTSATVRRAFEAIAYLKREGQFADAVRPALVLLDWKLAGTGLSVLRTIRESPELRTIPVIVLSRSGADADVTAAYSSFANAFVMKDMDLDGFHRQLTRICEFFLRVALLPGEGTQPLPLYQPTAHRG